jgi:hypothetical protein
MTDSIGATARQLESRVVPGNARNPLLEAALDLASRGFRVFPLRPGEKIPRIKGWKDAATTDPEQIRGWWAQFPHANIGIATGRGLLVVDVDKHKDGVKKLRELFAAHAPFPDTLIAKTQSDGLHFFFKLPDGVKLASGTDKLGYGVDVKCEGGLVVGAGSIGKIGAYRWDCDKPIADAPQWIIDLCDEVNQFRTDMSAKRIIDSSPRAVEAARRWLLTAPIAIESHGGDQTTVAVCRRLADFGVTEAEAFDLLTEPGGWNEHCKPRWGADELKQKISNGFMYRLNPIGCESPDVLRAGLRPRDIPPRYDKQAETSNKPPGRILTKAEFLAEFISLDYLLDGILLRGFLYSLTAPTGTAKTALALLIAKHVSSKAPATLDGRAVQKGRTAYFAGENPTDLQMRLIGDDATRSDATDDDIFFCRACSTSAKWLKCLPSVDRSRSSL